MRMYKNFREGLKEIHRDLSEMGLLVHPKTYQDKFVGDNPGFQTLELQHYNYQVLSPLREEVELALPGGGSIVPTQPWADAEFDERVRGINLKPVNPGLAWDLRSNVWETFRGEDGKFAYTYGERFASHQQVQRVIKRIGIDPDSRQLWISVWDPRDITQIGGVSRVPCTMGYQVMIRRGALDLHYIQRSADFITHFCNDVYLATRLQAFLAEQTGYPVGYYTHTVFSLHMFKKDAEGVF